MQHDTEETADTSKEVETGDYNIGDDIGERVGEGNDPLADEIS